MSPTHTEFQIDRAAVLRAAWQRLLLRTALAAAALYALAWTAQTQIDPGRGPFFWSAATALLFVYGAVEFSALRWAKRSAPVMVVRLTPSGLECWIGPSCHPMAWADISPPRVRRWRGRISRIDVRDSKGHGVRLAGFQDMESLASGIVSYLAAR